MPGAYRPAVISKPILSHLLHYTCSSTSNQLQLVQYSSTSIPTRLYQYIFSSVTVLASWKTNVHPRCPGLLRSGRLLGTVSLGASGLRLGIRLLPVDLLFRLPIVRGITRQNLGRVEPDHLGHLATLDNGGHFHIVKDICRYLEISQHCNSFLFPFMRTKETDTIGASRCASAAEEKEEGERGGVL